MPTTRKKVIKTVYKDEESDEGGDFSDSGSDAVLSQPSSSEEEDYSDNNSDNDFKSVPQKSKKQSGRTKKTKKTINFTKSFISKINKQKQNDAHSEEFGNEPLISIKDLTDADKLLPSVLKLSESESSEDELPEQINKKNVFTAPSTSKNLETHSDSETNVEYKDVWSKNNYLESEEIARKTYLELEKHKNKIEETKITIQNYVTHTNNIKEADIKDLLAMGEEEATDKSNIKIETKDDDSDTEMEDWEEVKESKGIPKHGLQLIVNIPDGICRKSKTVDLEMMMKRKMNRVKKEHQIYMHKVHVLCWLGHGNYVSQVLNDQQILSAILSLLPAKECYPGKRVDMKYIEQITVWYKNKITLKQDKNENKFKPKAPSLKNILLKQIQNKIFTSKKFIALAYIAMLRSLGLQCRVMFNFVTVPIRPPQFELCSLSTKTKDNKDNSKSDSKPVKKITPRKNITKSDIPQLDGNYDLTVSDSDMENIMQLDGNDDITTKKEKKNKSSVNKHQNSDVNLREENVSPPKRPKRQTRSRFLKCENDDRTSTKTDPMKPHISNIKSENNNKSNPVSNNKPRKSLSLTQSKKINKSGNKNKVEKVSTDLEICKSNKEPKSVANNIPPKKILRNKDTKIPNIIITEQKCASGVSSKYFDSIGKVELPSRKRCRTVEPKTEVSKKSSKPRAKSTQAKGNDTSKYFDNVDSLKTPRKCNKSIKEEIKTEDDKRVSHKDLLKTKKDVTKDLIDIVKGRIKEAKSSTKKGIAKEKIKKESDEDSDYLPVESPKRKKSNSDDDFKSTKITPKSKVNSLKKKDRRLLSTDDEGPSQYKVDVWAEVFVEELEEWISVDVIKGKVHCTNGIYNGATHPVCYVVGWDNNNKLKDLTRKYVPHWNTVTRKQRVDLQWWETALQPWLGPKTARDREEDERLDRMQLDAPLPKSISEYKNHPLYALSRHLLKFEAIYPPDAPSLGFVRGEPVYARNCVHVCRSRDTWLKEAKVVRLGEQPYKVVKARPKWDKLSNKLITDKPLEVFGPWQVQDYEPPTAENGIVPRNAYGNVELFKECMLPKGTVHIKLPGLNRVAKKWNIDCAPAMTGFEFNGGWSHPVYDGFVVCEEFKEIITDAWVKDQEEQERKEVEKLEARVYGNWKKLIKGLFIKERLKAKYGFEGPSTSKEPPKSKGPKIVVKKKKCV